MSGRIRVRVTGTVQGVGFRPFVARLARALGAAGWVRNDAAGVVLEAEAPQAALAALVERLRRDAPPLARIDQVAVTTVAPTGAPGFTIRTSAAAGSAATGVAADAATCDACLAELFEPADRRWRYPFVNCTECGPRFTIACGIPWDRPQTTMAGFPLCPDCRREYEDPADRRFHAEPLACPACGPQARLIAADGSVVAAGPPGADDAIAGAARALAAGAIVAVKGIGGFHLACRADAEDVVARLRRRKQREEKPFALLVRDLAAARALAHVDTDAAALLRAVERPIVLVPRRPHAAIAASVAPGAPDLGLLLPYAPLHHLLAADLAALGIDALVLTSGNVADEPIAFADADARARLAGIADLFLVHDRPIRTRSDDSVARTVRVGANSQPLLLRRGRGWVPGSFALPVAAARPLVACGADLKNTFCLARGNEAWLGPHVGDLGSEASLAALADGVAHLAGLFAVAPEVVVHDLHPDFHSTSFARSLGLPAIAVQHHHAHLAAVLAEHRESGPALGVIFDGMGLGSDSTLWGGEFLAGDLAACERVGHLLAVPQPGGDRAAREPWRMACAWVQAACGSGAPPPAALAARIPEPLWHDVAALAARGVAAPPTSSVGRLFDAVAALCGLHAHVSYEAQAAIALEAAAAGSAADGYHLDLDDSGGVLVLDPRAAIRAVVADVAAGVAPAHVSARFHAGLAAATAAAALRLAAAHGLDRIVLAGGVFQNRLLLEATAARLLDAGRRVLLARALPANDGAIAFGQAAVAAARLAA